MKTKRAYLDVESLKEILNLPKDYNIIDISLDGLGAGCNMVFECDRFEDMRGTIIRKPTHISQDIPLLTPSKAKRGKAIVWEATTQPKSEPAQPARAEEA